MATREEQPRRQSTQPALTEIRWHGRGGQGAVTAAKMVAELALGQRKYFQAFPEYGPERSGAPIVAFTRVSDDPIQVYSGVEHPQIVVVLDPSLLSIVDVTKGAPDDAIVLVNSEMAPAELRAHYHMQGRRLYTVRRHRASPSRPSAGRSPTPPWSARSRASPASSPSTKSCDFLRAEFGKKFPPKVVEGNIAAITRSYEEVQGE